MKKSYVFIIAGALFLTIGSTKSVVFADTEQTLTSQNETTFLTSTLKDSGTYGTSSWELYTDGTMTVSSGSFVGELVRNAPWQKYSSIVKKITFTGPVTLQPEANHLFANCRLLTAVNTEQLDTSLVTNMGGMFFYCTSLTSVDLSTWNTSSATNMGGMFGNCYALTSLNLENFDVSNVTSIAGIFANSGLMDLQISTWNTLSVTDMSAAFYNNRALTYLDITSWSSPQVASMSAMFGNCTSLSGIKLGNNMSFLANTLLPQVTQNKTYTGRWVGLDTKVRYDSSNSFLSEYDGAQPDTFIWENRFQTITFDSIGGSDIPAQVVETDYQAIEPEQPTKEGYSFTGWYTDEGCTNQWAFSTPVSYTMTLFAGWQKNLETYTINFETNGGDPVASQSVLESTLAEEPIIPRKEGYAFLGWYTDISCTLAWSFETPVTQDMTLYAGWQEKKYTVSFESNGGTPLEDMVVQENSLLSKPKVPMKEGYQFVGWFSDPRLTKVWDFNTPVVADLQLYAKWELITENKNESNEKAEPKNDNESKAKTIKSNGTAVASTSEPVKYSLEKNGKMKLPKAGSQESIKYVMFGLLLIYLVFILKRTIKL